MGLPANGYYCMVYVLWKKREELKNLYVTRAYRAGFEFLTNDLVDELSEAVENGQLYCLMRQNQKQERNGSNGCR